MTLGHYLKQLRQHRKLTQRALSERLSSASHSTLSRIENGRNRPTLATLQELSRFYATTDLGHYDPIEADRLSAAFLKLYSKTS